MQLNVKVILGSVRRARFGDKPAYWILNEFKSREGVQAELLDLRDYPMPFYEEEKSPKQFKDGIYSNPQIQKWANKIKEADGFVIVTAEYNHGYPASLKNALDSIFWEWNQKPIGFIGYGSVGGARAVEQLRQVAVELDTLPIRNAIHIPWQMYMVIKDQPIPPDSKVFEPLNDAKEAFITQLLWSANMLKEARRKQG